MDKLLTNVNDRFVDADVPGLCAFNNFDTALLKVHEKEYGNDNIKLD